MATLTADCPRCGASSITFDVNAAHKLSRVDSGWVSFFEAFGVCRNCGKSTVFVLKLKSYDEQHAVKDSKFWQASNHLNDFFTEWGFISIKDKATFGPPDHVPDEIAEIFREGATCVSVECFNAAATMFRLCVDLVTKPLLPDIGDTDAPQPSKHQRYNLKARIEWLIENSKIPSDLEEVLDNLREDGNDGAHDGTLGSDDATDIADFATLLLQRLYTNPTRLRLARERRESRRKEAKAGR